MVNAAKFQEPGLSVKFLAVVWSGKKVIPDAIIDKIQLYLPSTTVKKLQSYVELLGYWRVFVPHLSQLAWPLYGLMKKGPTWDWNETERVFATTKQVVQQARALQVTDPGKPFELDVHVTAEEYDWGL